MRFAAAPRAASVVKPVEQNPMPTASVAVVVMVADNVRCCLESSGTTRVQITELVQPATELAVVRFYELESLFKSPQPRRNRFLRSLWAQVSLRSNQCGWLLPGLSAGRSSGC